MRRFLISTLLGLFLFANPSYAASISTFSDIKNITNETEVLVNTSLSVNSQDGTEYFLRGVFFKPGTSDYCGYTWNGIDFFSGPYSTNSGWKNFYPSTIISSSWSGALKVKIDTKDSGCSQSGSYSFKVQRFTNSGSAVFDPQNELSFEVVIPTPTSTVAPTPTPIKTTPTKTIAQIPSAPAKVNTPSPLKPSKALLESEQVSPGSALVQTLTASSSSQIKAETPTPVKEEIAGISEKKPGGIWILISGFGILGAACGILLFQKYKKKKGVNYEE